jgi:hypothetical protein
MDPPSAVRNRGFGPTGIEASTPPIEALTATNMLLANPVIQTTPSLKSGLQEPGGIPPPKSYTKATDRRIFISLSTMAKSLGALSRSFEITDK